VLRQRIQQLFTRLQLPFKRSIRQRIIITMVCLVIPPTVAVTVLATNNSSEAMEDQVIKTNLSNMKWTGIYLDQQFDQLNSLVYSALIHSDMNSYLSSYGRESLSEQYDDQRKISNLITNIFYSAGNYMVGVELYVDDHKKQFSYNSAGSVVNSLTTSPETFNLLVEQDKDLMLQTDEQDASKFQIIRSINRFENRQKQGYIALDVRWTMMDQTLDLLTQGSNHPILLVNSDGELLYQSSGTAISEQLWQEVYEVMQQPVSGPAYYVTDDAYIFYNTSSAIELKLIKVIPKSFVHQGAIKTMKYGFIVGLVSVIVAMIIAAFLGWKISKPIVQLARSMRGLNFMRKQEQPISSRIDEIGLLEVKLSNMQSRIQEYILNEYQMELDKKNAELRALQAQINPHFIQNTMQMIGSMIFSNSPEQSYHMIRSLSDMFRYVLREPDQLATLEAELKHMQNYMSIQEQRFGKRLQVLIDYDKQLASVLLPKLTLQPIVENAFFHGLEPKSGDWHIHISIQQEQDYIYIFIRDNGVGMSSEQLEKLRARLKLDHHEKEVWTSGKHIGLVNIASRIQIQFGDNYGIEVNSWEHEGTEVIIKLPNTVKGDFQ